MSLTTVGSSPKDASAFVEDDARRWQASSRRSACSRNKEPPGRLWTQTMAAQDTRRRSRRTSISVAAPDDIPEILALQSENQVSRGGALSVEFPAQWFESAIKDLPIVVARRDGRLVGYLVSSSQASTQTSAASAGQAARLSRRVRSLQFRSAVYCGERARTRPRRQALRNAAIALARARGRRLHPARQCRVTSRSRQVWISRGRGVLPRRCRISGGFAWRPRCTCPVLSCWRWLANWPGVTPAMAQRGCDKPLQISLECGRRIEFRSGRVP